MNLNEIRYAYFLGIGGVGMSAIARYFKSIGIEVKGYDRTRNEMSVELEKEGFDIHYFEDIQEIPEGVKTGRNGMVIYTPAIPKDNAEYLYFLENRIRLFKRAEVLGMITKGAFTIAVAGTHGKTTTSSLIAAILHENKVGFTAFLGGICNNFNSNYYHSESSRTHTDLPIMVVEADEFDRSFLHLQPDIAIVTSTEADHLDIYGAAEEVKKSFQEFVEGIKQEGVLIQREGLELKFEGKNIQYGPAHGIGAGYKDVRVENNRFCFDFTFEDKQCALISGLPGLHNIENATAAMTVSRLLGLDDAKSAMALKEFKGVRRRFEYVVNTDSTVIIDDYAHHPTELRAAISAVRTLYPEREILGIFQPHLYSRTRDFADEFADALDMLDKCWLLDIYPAREQPIEGINSEFLALKMNKSAELVSKESVIRKVRESNPELIIILGAGDIDQLVAPLQKLYE